MPIPTSVLNVNNFVFFFSVLQVVYVSDLFPRTLSPDESEPLGSKSSPSNGRKRNYQSTQERQTEIPVHSTIPLQTVADRRENRPMSPSEEPLSGHLNPV